MRAVSIAMPLVMSAMYLMGFRGLDTWSTMPLPSLHHVAAIASERLPQPQALSSEFINNTDLRQARKLFEGLVQGSETVAVDRDGNLMMLDKFGYLHKAVWAPPGGGSRATEFQLQRQPVAYVGPGRPLGFHLDSSGDLIICDSLKGLMRLSLDSHRLELLANRATLDSPLDPGTPIHYANDLDIASDGRIFFTDSSAIPPALGRGGWYDTLQSYMLTMWQGGATGRLLVHTPSTRQTHVLASGLWFPNGVALARDESFVAGARGQAGVCALGHARVHRCRHAKRTCALARSCSRKPIVTPFAAPCPPAVVETCSMRVRRHWLKGPQAGSTDVLTAQLPGFPDGISRSSDGNFWLSILLPPSPLLRWVLPSRALRGLLAWLPNFLLPRPPPVGLVLKVSASGQVVAALGDPDGGHVSHVSSATERGKQLFLGNLAGDYVSVVDLDRS